MQDSKSEAVLDIAWEASPSLAIEVGAIPPRQWEDVTTRGRAELAARAREQSAQIGDDDALSVASRFHLETAASLAEVPVVQSLNHMTGPVAAAGWSADAWPLGIDTDCSAYLELLNTMRNYTDDLISTVNEQGGHFSKPVLEAFIAQTRTLDAAHDDTSGPLFKPFLDARQLGVKVDESVARNAVTVARECFADLSAFASRLLPSGDASSPLLATPAEYKAAILRGTSIAMTPDEIQQLGYDILRETESEIHSLLAQFDVDELIPAGRILEQFESTYELLSSRIHFVCDVRPQARCVVRVMPDEQAQVGPPAFYGPASHENARPGILYANCVSPIKTWERLPLVIHESVPGHHLQVAIVDESPELPAVLNRLYPKAIVEGWAVYAESLGEALGIDMSPADRFGVLSCRRWRASRLVVDVGLHAQSWSVERATEFMTETTRQDPANVRREVIRYLAWPAQALSYTVGAETIRKWVDNRVASGETPQHAHTELLNSGYVTLDYLRD